MMQQPSSVSPFHVLAKPIGPKCNIDCSYCFYLEKEKLYPKAGSTQTGRRQAGWAMSDEVLESFIRQKLQTGNLLVESFAWQGGEPTLLGVDYFRKVVALQRKHADGRRIENAFQTNGILLDDTWCEFFKENDFLVGLSIDGPQELHDRYRVDKAGNATFERVMAGIALLKKHGVTFNTLTVVHRHNAEHPLEIYRFLKQAGSGVMQFIPIVERLADAGDPHGLKLVLPQHKQAEVSDWSVRPAQFGSFLTTIFDHWVRHDVGRAYVQLFDVALKIWFGLGSDLCLFSETCGRALAIEHNGDLYSCDHYVYPQNKLGNILHRSMAELVDSPLQQAFGAAKKEALPGYCQNCEVRFLCHGECPKNRFLTTPDGEPGLNYLCQGYKAFFNHITPYLRFMAQELRQHRAPANVMAWAREKDRGFPSLSVGRNDKCPCGSDVKFKRCCGGRA